MGERLDSVALHAIVPLISNALATRLPLIAARYFAQAFILDEPQPPTVVFSLPLTHFQALLLFAAIISVAFGFVSRRRALPRLKYILWSLLLFLLIGIGIGWAMYPFSR